MGEFESKLNIFFIGDLRNADNCKIIFNELFPASKENQATNGCLKNSFCPYVKLQLKKKISQFKIIWNSYCIFTNVSYDLMEEIFRHIKEIHTEDKEKNNVIVCFSEGEEKNKEVIKAYEAFKEKESEQVIPFLVFVDKKQIQNNIGNNNNNNLSNISNVSSQLNTENTSNIINSSNNSNSSNSQIINYIQDNNNNISNNKDYRKLYHINYLPYFSTLKETANCIKSKLLTIDAYFNERGSIFEPFIYDNQLNIERLTASTCINIFLTGESRAGKSCFVNLSKGELCARESPDVTAVTTKCTEYLLPINNTITNQNDILKGRIKLIDSPGFDNDINIEIAKNSILKYKKKADDSKDMIHLALYFMKEGNVFNKAKINFLKFLLKNDINVFFIINYANDDEKSGITKKSIKQMVKEEFKENYNKIIFEGEYDNIIQVNLKQVGKYGKPIFGIQNLYNKIYRFFRPETYDQNLFQQLSDNSGNFKEQLAILKKQSFLFNKISCIDDIKRGSRSRARNCVLLSTAAAGLTGFTPVPLVDIPLVLGLQINMVLAIGGVYEFREDEYDVKGLIISNGKKLSTNELMYCIKTADKEKIKKETLKMGAKFGLGGGAFALKELIITITKEAGKRASAQTASELLKFVPFFGTLIGGLISASMNAGLTISLGLNTIDSFEKRLMNDNGSTFLWKRLKVYTNIFDQFQHLSLKNDWKNIE